MNQDTLLHSAMMLGTGYRLPGLLRRRSIRNVSARRCNILAHLASWTSKTVEESGRLRLPRLSESVSSLVSGMPKNTTERDSAEGKADPAAKGSRIREACKRIDRFFDKADDWDLEVSYSYTIIIMIK